MGKKGLKGGWFGEDDDIEDEQEHEVDEHGMKMGIEKEEVELDDKLSTINVPPWVLKNKKFNHAETRADVAAFLEEIEESESQDWENGQDNGYMYDKSTNPTDQINSERQILNQTSLREQYELCHMTRIVKQEDGDTVRCTFCPQNSVAEWKHYHNPNETVYPCLRCQWLYMPVNPSTGWPYAYSPEKSMLVKGIFEHGSEADLPQNVLLARRSDLDTSGSTCPRCETKIPNYSDYPVAVMPCCGSWGCLDCVGPLKTSEGEECVCHICWGSLDSPASMEYAKDFQLSTFIEIGKCGHAFHKSCINRMLNMGKGRCYGCEEEWKPRAARVVSKMCICGEKVPESGKELKSILHKGFTDDTRPHIPYLLGINVGKFAPFQPIKRDAGHGSAMHVNMLLRAADLHYVPALCQLVDYVDSMPNSFPEINWSHMVQIFLREYENNPHNPSVCFALARLYANRHDRYNHVKYLKLAAKNGHAEATGLLGRLYWGSKLKSTVEIFTMFLYAATNAHVECRRKFWFYIAEMFSVGKNVERFEYLFRASNAGHVEATYLLGTCYIMGWGCEKNYAFARYYLERAHFMGHHAARDVHIARIPGGLKILVSVVGHPEISFELNAEPYYTIGDLKSMIRNKKELSPDEYDLIPCSKSLLQYTEDMSRAKAFSNSKEIQGCLENNMIFLRLRRGIDIPTHWEKYSIYSSS